jgi:hypothetical protein
MLRLEGSLLNRSVSLARWAICISSQAIYIIPSTTSSGSLFPSNTMITILWISYPSPVIGVLFVALTFHEDSVGNDYFNCGRIWSSYTNGTFILHQILGKYGLATPAHIFSVRHRWKTQSESYSTATGGHSTWDAQLHSFSRNLAGGLPSLAREFDQ